MCVDVDVYCCTEALLPYLHDCQGKQTWEIFLDPRACLSMLCRRHASARQQTHKQCEDVVRKSVGGFRILSGEPRLTKLHDR